MDRFFWNPNYSCGHPAIDRQHRFLLESALEIREQFGTHDRGTISLLIRSLIDYCQYHFRAEEALLVRLRPELLEAHKDEHDRIWAYLQEVWGLRDQMTPEELFELVADWIVGHVLSSDQDLKFA